jgi:hypothetical protein
VPSAVECPSVARIVSVHRAIVCSQIGLEGWIHLCCTVRDILASLADEKEKVADAEMKGFDDFQRKKHELNMLLGEIRVVRTVMNRGADACRRRNARS